MNKSIKAHKTGLPGTFLIPELWSDSMLAERIAQKPWIRCNWRAKVIMQPFFGHTEGGDKIKIRLPHRYSVKDSHERT